MSMDDMRSESKAAYLDIRNRPCSDKAEESNSCKTATVPSMLHNHITTHTHTLSYIPAALSSFIGAGVGVRIRGSSAMPSFSDATFCVGGFGTGCSPDSLIEKSSSSSPPPEPNSSTGLKALTGAPLDLGTGVAAAGAAALTAQNACMLYFLFKRQVGHVCAPALQAHMCSCACEGVHATRQFMHSYPGKKVHVLALLTEHHGYLHTLCRTSA